MTAGSQSLKKYLPIRTVNGCNVREHWGKRARRTAAEREAGCLITPAGLSLPITVKLTRVGKNKRRMDTDGLAASFKAIRDGIADKLRVDDGNKLVTFEYAQRYAKEYGVEIEFLRDSGAR